MNWRQYWNQLAKQADPHRQVARTVGGQPVDDHVLDRIASHIAKLLELRPSDRLLDVCCGNGQLTGRLARQCAEVTGVDLAPAQIELARQQNDLQNLSFLVGNATRLPSVASGPFDKINLYFSFQYLDTKSKGRAALQGMHQLLAPGGKILLGDVPETEKLHVFFPNTLSRLRYRIQLLTGRSPMGKFWSETEIAHLAGQLDLTCERVDQPTGLPFAHYRCDYLLSKK